MKNTYEILNVLTVVKIKTCSLLQRRVDSYVDINVSSKINASIFRAEDVCSQRN